MNKIFKTLLTCGLFSFSVLIASQMFICLTTNAQDQKMGTPNQERWQLKPNEGQIIEKRPYGTIRKMTTALSRVEPSYEVRIKTKFQYSVKIICTLLTPSNDLILANGIYRTIVNIHNPTEKKVRFAKKAVIAEQGDAPPGPFSVTPFEEATLWPNAAMEIDCGGIAGFFCPIDFNGFQVCVDFAYFDGFLVICSPVELDVVAVYTARSADGQVETLEVEQVEPRRVEKSIVVKKTVDVESFRELARNATCADISNRLFLIDKNMVFWDRQGNCSDNRFAYTLYGKSPDEEICSRKDSIAGSQESCKDNTFQGLFQTIINNLAEDDLGLGTDHQVEPILF